MIYNIDEELEKYELAKTNFSNVPADKWESTEVVTDENGRTYTAGVKDGMLFELQPNEEETTNTETQKAAVIPNAVEDIAKGSVRGMSEAGKNTTSFVSNVVGAPGDVANWIGQNITSNENFDMFLGGEDINNKIQQGLTWVGDNIMGNNAVDQWAAEDFNNETLGQVSELIAQFATPAIPAAKVTKAADLLITGMQSLNPFKRSLIWGAIADAAAFPENQETLTGMLAKYVAGQTPEERTAFGNAIVDVFEKNPEHAGLVNQLKGSLEGLVLGSGIEAFMRVAVKGSQLINWKELFDRIEFDPNTVSSGGLGGISLKKKPQEVNSIDIMNANVSPVIGTGKNNKVTIKDITEYLNQGPKLDITKPENINQIVIKSIDEINYQLNQEKTGLGWYDNDVKEAMDLLDEINPKFKNNADAKGLMPFLTAIASAGTPVGQDFKVATQIADIFLDTGKLPFINPKTGKGWTRRSHIPGQLEFVQKYIDNNGLSSFLEFLHTPTTRKEVNELRKQYNMKPVAGALYSEIVGADIFGPKVSKFMANLMGVSDENVPDIWFTRGFNRKAGNMYITTKDGLQSYAEQPRNLSERQIMDDVISKISQEIKLNNRDTQAVLWYFEQGLYTKLGVKSEPKSYADVTRQILEGKTNVSDGSIP